MNATAESTRLRHPVRFENETDVTGVVAKAMTSAHAAQPRWARMPLAHRLKLIRELRHLIAENALALAEASAPARQRPAAESLTAEVMPLAEACRFLERTAEKILAPRRLKKLDRPLWLAGVRSKIHREPFGVILIIGPGNYPLLLPGVQLVQALAAGNAVVLKPGRGGTAAAATLCELVTRAGFDPQICSLLPEAPEAAQAAIALRPDKVVFTGAAATGEKVLAQLASKLIPATMELSGCDAAIIRADADLALAVNALTFGVTLNDGATCMAPKRVLVAQSIFAEFKKQAAAADEKLSALSITSFENDDEAVFRANDCEYALTASIFSRDEMTARSLAARINAGVVTINDLIIPTADARLPFGGRGRSGFGTTRGAEGLLELTTPKVITVSRSKFRPAFATPQPGDENIFCAYLKLAHGCGWKSRGLALFGFIRAISRNQKTSGGEK